VYIQLIILPNHCRDYRDVAGHPASFFSRSPFVCGVFLFILIHSLAVPYMLWGPVQLAPPPTGVVPNYSLLSISPKIKH